MLFTELKVKDKTYKLRLGARECVDVEKKLGKSALSVLMSMAPSDGDLENVKEVSVPRVEELITILHGALQKYQHGVTLDETFDIYDTYIDGGGSLIEMLSNLEELFEVSGFLPKQPAKELSATEATSEANA